MLRFFAAVILACFPLARAADLTGRWDFTHADDHFRGTIVLRQSDAVLSGTWHTSFGKSEADTPVSGRVDGDIVMLTRFIGPNRQVYLLTLSQDGARLDGFGEGFFLSHTNLNMQRRISASTAKKADAEPIELSGTWIFTHDGDRFEGIITLSQTGSDLSGSWHTTKGKSEADTSVAGRIEGRSVTLTRFIGTARQDYILTLYDAERLYGFGEGFFLNHTSLDMQRLFSDRQ